MLHITPLELAALQLLAEGKTSAEIAGHWGTSEGEVKRSLRALFARMGVASQSEALSAAARRGLLVSRPVPTLELS